MSDIIYPTLDLFLYDLRDGLGENPGEVSDNQAGFARKLPERIRPIVQRDIAVESEYVELLGHTRTEKFDSSSQKYALKGFYYPVKMWDIYGLLLDVSVEHSLGHPERSKTEACPVSCLADLKAELDRRLADQPSTIGQVLMVSGQIPNFTPEKAEAVAKACGLVPELELDWDLDFQDKSQFMGGMLFGLSRYQFKKPGNSSSSDPSPIHNIHELQDNHCVLIALYPDQETDNNASEFKFEWLRLFAYRSKILWAYGQSEYLKNQLRNDSVKIKQYINDFNQAQTRRSNFKKLRQTLVNAQNTLSNYSIKLSDLNTQKRTIEVELLNYKRRLDRIKKRFTEFQADNEMKFLNQFGEDLEQRYLLQVQNDYESLSPRLTVLEDLINSIRGVTEIDQAERDSNFQNTVAIFGIGLAAGSIVASIATQFPNPSPAPSNVKEAAKNPVASALSQLGVPDPWLSPAISTTVSIGTVVIAALLTTLIISLRWCLRK
jgi:hypothetical protein